jgi:hypothetical protein
MGRGRRERQTIEWRCRIEEVALDEEDIQIAVAIVVQNTGSGPRYLG